MNHFLLKFNHGVEIGANLAYLGHYRRTLDPKVKEIAEDEVEHKLRLEFVMDQYGVKPSKLIDGSFLVIGTCIYWSCQISPKFALNFVARTMELFAIYNYSKLAYKYSRHGYGYLFREMADKEREHEEYFK